MAGIVGVISEETEDARVCRAECTEGLSGIIASGPPKLPKRVRIEGLMEEGVVLTSDASAPSLIEESSPEAGGRSAAAEDAQVGCASFLSLMKLRCSMKEIANSHTFKNQIMVIQLRREEGKGETEREENEKRTVGKYAPSGR